MLGTDPDRPLRFFPLGMLWQLHISALNVAIWFERLHFETGMGD